MVKRVFILICLLNLTCGLHHVTKEETEAEVQITEFYPCAGYDAQNQPLKSQTVFQSDAKRIHICAFLDPKSTGLRYESQELYLTVNWGNESSNDFFRPFWKTYLWTGSGWFYPVLEAPQDGFPVGTYEVELTSGKLEEAITTFEVISAK